MQHVGGLAIAVALALALATKERRNERQHSVRKS
jgi:hypothetical protein